MTSGILASFQGKSCSTSSLPTQTEFLLCFKIKNMKLGREMDKDDLGGTKGRDECDRNTLYDILKD